MELVNESDIKQVFVCFVCKQTFQNKHIILWHIMNVHKDEPAIKKLQDLKAKNVNMKKKGVNLNPVSKKQQGKHKSLLKCRKVEKYLKEYECEVCNYKTVHMSTFKRHLLTHEKNTRIHKCTYCSYAAIQPYNLKRHLNDVHPFGVISAVVMSLSNSEDVS